MRIDNKDYCYILIVTTKNETKKANLIFSHSKPIERTRIMKKIILTFCFALILGQQIFASTKINSDKFYRVKKEFHKTITLEKSIPLHVYHSLGNIKIIPSKNNQLTIDALIEVASKSKEKATEYIESVTIDVQERLTHIKISSDFPREKGIRSISINFSMRVPEKCPLDLKNSFGDIDIGETEGMKGGMNIENAHGEVFLTLCEGEAYLVNKFGSVKIMTHKGDLDIECANSKVETSKIKGNLTVENTFGKVAADQIEGDVKISNSNDQVSVSEVKGQLDLRNSFGEIQIMNVKKGAFIKGTNCNIQTDNITGDTKIYNSFGSIESKMINGDLMIDTQNSKINAADINGDVTIDNSFAAVNLQNIEGKVNIKNPNGNITAVSIKSDVLIRSTFSNISLKEISGSVEVHNTNGSVTGTTIDGNVDTENTFGPVKFDNIKGNIRIDNGNGSIRLANIAVMLSGGMKKEAYCERIDCSTSFGSIQLTLPKQASVEINAKTTWGKIDSELPLQIEEFYTSDNLVGKVGNGDTIINLIGKNSNIYLISEK